MLIIEKLLTSKLNGGVSSAPVARATSSKSLAMGFFLAAAMTAPLGPAAAQGKTFTYASSGSLVSLDPQSTRVLSTTAFLANIMEPLVRFDENYEPEPALATSWELVSPTKWRFHLRENVKFGSGNPFTAEDVKFTIERAKDEASAYRGIVASIAGVEKVSDFVVDIDTNGPNPILLRELPTVLILDSKWLRDNNAAEPLDATKEGTGFLFRNASGTGPYRLESYQPDVGAELAANAEWWDEANRDELVRKVSFKPVKSDATRVAALLSGEVDMVDPLPVDDIARLQATPNFKALIGPSARTILLGLDMKSDELFGSDVKGKNPFKDERVRRAMYQALDTDALISKIMNGLASPAAINIAPGISGYDKNLDVRDFGYDPEAAKNLLAEAGYPNGFSFTLDCTVGRYINDEKVCLALVPMWARVGLKVNLASRPAALHFAELQKGNSNVYVTGWGTDFVLDGNLFLVDVAHSKGGPYGASNYGSYSNPKVDELTEKARVEMDPEARAKLISDAYAEVKQDLAFMPLYNEKVVWGAREGVVAEPTLNNALWLYRVRLD